MDPEHLRACATDLELLLTGFETAVASMVLSDTPPEVARRLERVALTLVRAHERVRRAESSADTRTGDTALLYACRLLQAPEPDDDPELDRLLERCVGVVRASGARCVV